MTTDSFLLKINCSTVTIIIHSFADEMRCYSVKKEGGFSQQLFQSSNQISKAWKHCNMILSTLLKQNWPCLSDGFSAQEDEDSWCNTCGVSWSLTDLLAPSQWLHVKLVAYQTFTSPFFQLNDGSYWLNFRLHALSDGSNLQTVACLHST